MYLEKIDIQGFKSFAKKTTLKFIDNNKKGGRKNRGLTVIVGPNGSGKSNIADAVRWVLGEQSVKLLRGKRNEDVIFSGSHKKSSQSFAEVSLYLNNEDKSAPIDYAELVITRRLYRSGESEYLINDSKARLLDISLLLAKAKFSQRAYSVVGQGMVENFLNTSPAERKEFFDEATGVKVFQIKRHDSANKLSNANNNLVQAEQLLNEIEPRMRSLTRQMKKLERRNEIDGQLRALQKNYYAQIWHSLSAKLKLENEKIIKYEERERQYTKDLQKIDAELNSLEKFQYQDDARENMEIKLAEVQNEYNQAMRKLAGVQARKDVAKELGGNTDINWLKKNREKLAEEIKRIKKEKNSIESAKTESQKDVVSIRKDQNILDQKIVGLRKKIISYYTDGNSGDDVIDELRINIDELLKLNTEIIRSIEVGEDANYIKKQLIELQEKINRLKNTAFSKQNRSEEDLQKLNSEIITLEEKKNNYTQNYIEAQSKVTTAQNRVNDLSLLIVEKKVELEGIEKKIAGEKESAPVVDKELVKEEESLKKITSEKSEKILQLNNELKKLIAEEKEKRDRIIAMQKKLHEQQNDYNSIINALNEVKVDKARHETRLEGIEREIRDEMGSLREVIDASHYKKIDSEEARAEIHKLKHQLEQIGGIDPEVAKEHDETKVRFDFLSKQVVDLRSAINSLQKVITELDNTIAERFDRAFKDIADQFDKYYKILFNGGMVKLEKIMEEEKKADESELNQEYGDLDNNEAMDKEEKPKKKKIELRHVKKILAGIDIVASPPGKKIKNISLLSGGERALTSIALIAAIIAVNPSPFVVLDEVDAALDEANSLRLGKILEDLSKRSQFIAITHNRTIMYKADIIYGVTMGDDGVSKLLSVKVEDVQAARR
ncbi:MAG: AAA family ATPase [bacterium]|nr:AAA family ATPase [bacterium]